MSWQVIILGIMPAYIQKSDLHVDLPYDLFEVPLMADCNEWQAAQQQYQSMFLDMLQVTHRDPIKEDPTALQAWNAGVVAALESPKVTMQMASLACQGNTDQNAICTSTHVAVDILHIFCVFHMCVNQVDSIRSQQTSRLWVCKLLGAMQRSPTCWISS